MQVLLKTSSFDAAMPRTCDIYLQRRVCGDLRRELFRYTLNGSEEFVVFRQAPFHIFLGRPQLSLQDGNALLSGEANAYIHQNFEAGVLHAAKLGLNM